MKKGLLEIMKQQHNIKRLKTFVNDKDVYDCFLDEIKNEICVYQKSLEQASDLISLHRLQGNIQALRRLLHLKEKVNGSN